VSGRSGTLPADVGQPVRRLHVLIFLSGASALVFEIIWIRALGLAFGTSTPAIATVVASFMAGLALGSFLAGRRADRHPNPLRLYSHLELGVAITGCAVSLLLLRVPGLLTPLARGIGPAGGGATLIRAGTCFALLAVPTSLMGGTLPVLARALVRSGMSGQRVGFLYAANTAGAVVGALLPDLWAVPALGMLNTTFLAVAADLGVALVARRLATETPVPVEMEQGAGRSVPALLLFGASGLCALGYELAWSRVMDHLLGGKLIGFSILLAVYLIAVAAGSRLTARVADRSADPLGWAAMFLALSGLAALISIATLGHWVAWVRHLVPEGPVPIFRPGFERNWRTGLLDSAFLEAVPSLLMGVGFPFLATAAVREGRAGRASGELYSVNTIAGIVGSLGTGFLLIPMLGLQRTMTLLCLVAVAVGVMASLRKRISWLHVPLGLTAVGVLALGFTAPARRLVNDLFPFREPPQFLEEGTTTSVAVTAMRSFGVERGKILWTPGVEMSGTYDSARRYQGLMGHLPLLFATRPGDQEALLICFGAGNTARSILSHVEVERLDVVDISPEVLRTSPLFAQMSGIDPLRDPRTHVFVQDGRFFLVSSDRTYDVITAEPPPPSNAGVVNLYSREFYQAARKALKPGGVLAQWLPVVQVTPDESLSMIASLADVFPQVGLFYGEGESWILLGSDHPLVVDVPEWKRRAGSPAVQADLALIGVQGVPDLAATYLQTDANLRAASADADSITDDRPLLQYPMADVKAPVPLAETLIGQPQELFTMIHDPDGALGSSIKASMLAQRLVLQALSEPQAVDNDEIVTGTRMRAALVTDPPNGDVLRCLGLGDDERRAAEAALGGDPTRLDARWLLARRAFYLGRWSEALSLIRGFAPGMELAVRYGMIRGGSERALGLYPDAAGSFSKAAASTSDPVLRQRLEALARGVAEPWSPKEGPLAAPEADRVP
jgi:spermidine synthase